MLTSWRVITSIIIIIQLLKWRIINLSSGVLFIILLGLCYMLSNAERCEVRWSVTYVTATYLQVSIEYILECDSYVSSGKH